MRYWSNIGLGLVTVVLIGATASIIFQPDNNVLVTVPTVDVTTDPLLVTIPTVEIVDELIPAISITAPTVIVVHTVCDDFDNGLWFWDMYEERVVQGASR